MHRRRGGGAFDGHVASRPGPRCHRRGAGRSGARRGRRTGAVRVQLADGAAHPLFGASALLSVLTRADGYLVVREPAAGLAAGSEASP
ncbi:MAG: hypothetical protein ACRDRM_05515 [Pseudonocardiaceae bacterium]